jgi:plastocyanin
LPENIMLRNTQRIAVIVLACAACTGEKTDNTTATPSTGAPPAGTAAAITGTTHVVQMVGDGSSARYVPDVLTIKSGDGIRFEVVSLPPHNVSFDNPSSLPAAAHAALAANMPDQELGELSSKLLNNIGDTYTISFTNVPAGSYDVTCVPHAALGMKMRIIVE